MFRTATGQTGLDAYKFEAAAIANAQRVLNERMHKLVVAIHEEAPETFVHSTDWWFSGGDHAQSLSDHLKKDKS